VVALACDCLPDQVRRRAVFAAEQAFLQPDGARQLRILIDHRRRGGLSSRCCRRRRLPAARALPHPPPEGVRVLGGWWVVCSFADSHDTRCPFAKPIKFLGHFVDTLDSVQTVAIFVFVRPARPATI